MEEFRMEGTSRSSFRDKVAFSARRERDRLHAHFAKSANFLAGDRIEFRVEAVTPVDGLEDGLEELCPRHIIEAFERDLRRARPHAEIALVDDLDR
jgi:hypothetical protein